MTLNFSLPHETIYSGANVNQVIVPGAAGEYGVTADHVPLVAQLKPGVLQILHEGTSDAERSTLLQEVSLLPMLIPPL